MRYANIYYSPSVPRDLYRVLLIPYYVVKILEYIVANYMGPQTDRRHTPSRGRNFPTPISEDNFRTLRIPLQRKGSTKLLSFLKFILRI